MSRRLYLGRLNPNTTKADIEDLMKDFRPADVRTMGNYAFVEFESARDAEDAVKEYDGKELLGERIIVEPSRDTRRRDFYDPYTAPRPQPRIGLPRRGIKINVIGVPSTTSWQDLKDFGRMGSNNILFADIDRNDPGNGVIAFPTIQDAEDAMSKLAGMDINGQPVKLELAPNDGLGDETMDRQYEQRGSDDRGGYGRGPPPPREYDRRPRYDDRPRYDERPRYDDDRRYDDRRRDDRPRFDDRAPPRRDDRDRYDRNGGGRDYDSRARSPPRRSDDRYARDEGRDERDARDTGGY